MVLTSNLPSRAKVLEPAVTAPLIPPAERRYQPLPRARPRWSGFIVWFVCFIAYTTIGLILNLKYQYTINDGLSRVANASYVLFGDDPHLSAVGFVWNPLPSLIELPIIIFRSLWQPLVTEGAAGIFMSSAFMAGSVVEIRAIVRDRTQSRHWVFWLTLAFALHPMILIYAGNGMSEAPYLLFTIWAARRLIRFLNYNRVFDLASCGLALGLDYLTRYESLAAGAAAVVLVVAATAYRTNGTRYRKIANAAMDGAIVGFPIFITFTFWTVASYVITGEAFLQFSSVYGNASQGALGGLNAASGFYGVNNTFGGPIGVIARNIMALEPLLPVILVAGLLFAIVRSDTSVLAPIAIFGGTLAFEAYEYLGKSTFPWLRFYMMGIPMAIIVVSMFKKADAFEPSWQPHPATPGSWRYHGPGAKRRRTLLLGGYRLNPAILAAALLIPSIPIAAASIVNPSIGLQEYTIRSVFDPFRYPISAEPEFQDYTSERQLAAYLDSMRNPRASVLVDTFLAWPIVMGSTDPDQFVITSDINFSAALNNPRGYGIKYLLVPDPSGYGGLDALNRRYPTLWASGAGFASLAANAPASGYNPGWRLYQLNATAS